MIFAKLFSRPAHAEAYPGFRSSQLRCSVRKGALRNFAKFTGKHLCQSLFFNEVAGLRLQISVNFVKFLRIPPSQNTSGWLIQSFAAIVNGYKTLTVVSKLSTLVVCRGPWQRPCHNCIKRFNTKWSTKLYLNIFVRLSHGKKSKENNTNKE